MWRDERENRYAVSFRPNLFDGFRNDQGAWHESPKQIRRGLQWGTRKRKLLAWVDATMEERLTARERECIRLYYYHDLTYRQIGVATETNASSAYRAVVRGIRKLREAAAADDRWRSY